MAGHPLRSATDRRLGGPLPHQLPNQTRIHLTPPEFFTLYHAVLCAYAVLAVISNCYPPVWGRLSTRYSPVRHSVNQKSIRKLHFNCFVRLACVRHAASVHPEPGSNSQIKCLRCQIEVQNHWFFSCLYCLFRFWTFVLFHGLSCRHHSQENPNEIWINVQGCFVIQLSRFCVFFRKRLIILSHLQILVKNFFQELFLLFKKSVLSFKCELLYFITQSLICQEFF